MPTKTKLEKRSPIRITAEGTVQALGSNGKDIYTVRIGIINKCNCPAGRFGRRCYHVATAQREISSFYIPKWR